VLQQHGHQLSVALICGGLGKNPLFVQTVADVLEMPVLLPKETESVLLGAAILGATAAGAYPTVQQAAKSMGGKATRVEPNLQTAE
jgi:ribulose kinase